MAQEMEHLQFSNTESGPLGHITINIPTKTVSTIFNHALQLQRQNASPIGFTKQKAPKNYLATYYQDNIINHLKEFFLKYPVISFLYQQLRIGKISSVGDPRLEHITIDPDKGADYIFTYTPAPKTSIRDWHYLPFKPPLRKKYQDIDKQAASFIAQERALYQAYASHEICANDWVLFELTILNLKKTPLIPDFTESLWIQISNEEAGEPFRTLFAGKKRGDTFISNHQCLQEYVGSSQEIAYTFQVIIKEVLPNAYFCFELFKEQFRLKSERKTHQKIVEIYSLQNDVSLRRSIVEEALALLARTYPFDIPDAAILRQEKIVLEELQENPDYAVYKLQQNFAHDVWQLAQKQLREYMVTDYFAQQENISVNDSDVCQYLNLTKRPRTKEFIYFMHPTLKVNEEEEPIPHELLKFLCRKEKAINHLLHHWNGS